MLEPILKVSENEADITVSVSSANDVELVDFVNTIWLVPLGVANSNAVAPLLTLNTCDANAR
jgi:hypothetical protein